MLRILKQQIDAELPMSETSLEYVEVARSYLIEREQRLIRSRKTTGLDQAPKSQMQPMSIVESFSRAESKRKSLSTALTSMFRRPGSGTGKTLFVCFEHVYS